MNVTVMPKRPSVSRRKTEHLDVCRNRDVEFRETGTWFGHVRLIHQALPAFSAAAIRTECRFLGRKLAAPFLIGAMTGGAREAARINRQLAQLAAAKGVGLALGSQRAMLEGHSMTATYRVRDIAPDVLLLGNIGLAQAAKHPVERIMKLIEEVHADGLCLHLNTAMELFQGEGDLPEGDGAETVRRLAKALGERLVVKETGCGISRETAKRLAGLGVHTVDVAGAGGTSWVRVENLRRPKQDRSSDDFEEWGIPTAASLLEMQGLKFRVISSGGVRSGLEVAKSIALGADLGSAALPILRVLNKGGLKAAERWMDKIIKELRAAMMLVGARDLGALRKAPYVIEGPLREWAEQRGLRRSAVGRKH
jgi:isopentenyl-diphosphate delta-isomerase